MNVIALGLLVFEAPIPQAAHFRWQPLKLLADGALPVTAAEAISPLHPGQTSAGNERETCIELSPRLGAGMRSALTP